MFFIENQLLQNKDTVIPNIFFEKILPILASEPNAVSVYLYGYYAAKNKNLEKEINTNKDLANFLGISIDDVYEAWRFCEELNIVKKHKLDDENTGSYNIEFRDLRTIGMKSKDEEKLSSGEIFSAFQNKEYKKMYEKVQSILEYPLIASDIKLIYDTIVEFNISKDLIVEAVAYSVNKRKIRKVSTAMSILRSWYLDGIRTADDLEEKLKGTELRYLQYRQIMNKMGEYRNPTKPEEEMIDKWLDDYNFTMEAVVEAIYKGLNVKTPTFKYIDGVLRNWNEEINNSNNKKQNSEDIDFEKRIRILELLGIKKKSLTKDERIVIDELVSNFDLLDIEIAKNFLLKNGKKITLENISKQFKLDEESKVKKKVNDIKSIDKNIKKTKEKPDKKEKYSNLQKILVDKRNNYIKNRKDEDMEF